MSDAPLLVEDERGLREILDRAREAPLVALDTEANGLFAYQARLCVMQLAWREGSGTAIAVVDALVAPIGVLAPLLDDRGPIKLLHDLTFDARILAAAGLPLQRVRDTEVAARLLGRPALGLASLLAADLGISMAKDLQKHDWSRRPLGREHLAYLAGDVAHLMALAESLQRPLDELDLEPEVAEETAYKLRTALREEPPSRPAWTRPKGATELDPAGRAVLRRLLAARDDVARARDVPAFHVIGSIELVTLARARPTDDGALRALVGRGALRGGGGDRLASVLRAAIAAGAADGDVPAEDLVAAFPPPPARAEADRRRRLERAIGAWRKREATRRGWCEQAVLPGHCARDLADALARPAPERAPAMRGIPGIGARRLAWFESDWLELDRVL